MSVRKRCRGLRYDLSKEGVYWVRVCDDEGKLVAVFTVDEKGNINVVSATSVNGQKKGG